jgi:predicted lipid-binding transport protein (Tim44 family)
VVLGGGAFGVYRLNLLPALNERIDGVLGAVSGSPAGPVGAFVGPDGSPVAPDGFGAPAEAAASVQPVSAAAPYIAPDVDRNALTADLASIRAAFASGDATTVATWVHPDAKAPLLAAFEANAGRLDEIAVLFDTLTPVFVTTEYAEYQATDKGLTFTVVFQKSGDHWQLAGL